MPPEPLVFDTGMLAGGLAKDHEVSHRPILYIRTLTPLCSQYAL